MNLSKEGYEFIVRREGVRNKAYKDSKSLWTIGIGHLIKLKEKVLLVKTLTDEEIEQLFRDDVKPIEEILAKFELHQNQYDALVSFMFNIGNNGFLKSTVYKLLSQGNTDVSDAMLMWNKPKEIIGRRKLEVQLYKEGIYG